MGKMTENTKIAPELTLFELAATDDQDVLAKLGQTMLDAGVVKESYLPAIQEREVSYPTGLQCGDMAIAIPHTDAEHVVQQSIGIALLKEPVLFTQMGTEDEKVAVKLVFMLGIKDPKLQIDFLQELMVLLEHPEELHKLAESADAKALCQGFIDYFAS